MLTKEATQFVELVNEKLAPGEAAEMIESLVGDRVRTHNVRMLQRWERNHHFDSAPFDREITQMKAQKQDAKRLIAAAKDMGLHVEVVARIEVRLVSKPFAHNVNMDVSQN